MCLRCLKLVLLSDFMLQFKFLPSVSVELLKQFSSPNSRELACTLNSEANNNKLQQ